MAADYDRLFQPPGGAEAPDEPGGYGDYDVDGPPPEQPAMPPKPNGRAAPPMPVDLAEQAQPSHRPLPVGRTEKPSAPDQPPWAQPHRPAPPADHDGIFGCSGEPDAADQHGTDGDYDVDGPPDIPAGPPKPNGQAKPPMPVDPPARSGPPPGAAAARTQVPVDQPRHARHSRQGQSDAPHVGPAKRGKSPNSHRAASQRGNAKAADPPVAVRPSASPAGPDGTPGAPSAGTPPARRNGQPLPVEDVVAQTESVPTDTSVRPGGKPPRPVSRRGWRRWIHTLTRINLGPSPDEKYELELQRRIRRPIRGSYEIGVLGLKGGAGRTAVTAALGSAFAHVRGDRILAVDADPVSGNLADRVGRRTPATVADLVANRALSHYNDVRAHTSMNADNLEVLSAANYTGPRPLLGEEEWKRALAMVPRYYNLVLADCGADLFGPAARGVLAAASGLVIVSSASVDGARRAAIALDWLRNNGYVDLLDRACVVINHLVPGGTEQTERELAARFQPHVPAGRVVALPWDGHVATGTEVRFALLSAAYQRRISELAAALSDDFDRGERR